MKVKIVESEIYCLSRMELRKMCYTILHHWFSESMLEREPIHIAEMTFACIEAARKSVAQMPKEPIAPNPTKATRARQVLHL